MRWLLELSKGEIQTFIGTFDKWVYKNKKSKKKVLLFKNITDENGIPICDHMWFVERDDIEAFRKSFSFQASGMIVQFDATVEKYEKGKFHEKKRNDYRLVNVHNVQRLMSHRQARKLHKNNCLKELEILDDFEQQQQL